MNVPPIVLSRLARDPTLHLGLTSKIFWQGGPDTGKTTHAKQTMLHYPKGVAWDPRGEFDPRFCARNGFLIGRTLEALEVAARRSSRIVLQPPQQTEGDDPKAFKAELRALGERFCWWVLRNITGPCFLYLDEPAGTIFEKNDLGPGLATVLRRGHKGEHNLAMGWSAWGARDMPNDLENVSHVIQFRPFERNDIARVDDHFGNGWSEVAVALPDYYHIVKQKNPSTRTLDISVFPPLKVA